MSATTGETNGSSGPGMTEELLRYLQQGRDGLLRSLDGLGDDAWWTGSVARIQAAADAHRTVDRLEGATS